MSQVMWRAPDELVARVREVARRTNTSMNEFMTRVLDAATNPDVAGDEVTRIRERLARAGLLADVWGPTSAGRPSRVRCRPYPCRAGFLAGGPGRRRPRVSVFADSSALVTRYADQPGGVVLGAAVRSSYLRWRGSRCRRRSGASIGWASCPLRMPRCWSRRSRRTTSAPRAALPGSRSCTPGRPSWTARRDWSRCTRCARTTQSSSPRRRCR